MAGSLTLMVHTTASTAVAMTGSLVTTSATAGTVDSATAWAAGDVIIVEAEEAGTGTTLAITTSHTGTGSITLEGLAADTTWSATTANCDAPTPIDDGTRFVRRWSAKITAMTAGTGSASFTATVTYGNSSTGTRRSRVWRLRPDSGKSVPVRASRILASKSFTGGSTGAGAIDSFDMSAGPGSNDVIELANYLAANSMATAPQLDPDNTSAYVRPSGSSFDADSNTTGAGAFGQFYAAADSHRPTSTGSFSQHVKWISNPSNSGLKVFAATVYAAETQVTTVTGTLTFTDAGVLTVAGTKTVFGTASTHPSTLITISGTRSVIGTLSLTDAGVLHLNQAGVTTVTGTLAFSDAGVLSANGHRIITATSATFGGGGALAIAGTRSVIGTLSLTDAGVLHADQLVAETQIDKGGTWSAMSNVRLGGRTWTGTTTFSNGLTLSAVGRIAARNGGILILQGGPSLRLTGTRKHFGTMAFAGGGVFRLLSVPPTEPPSRLLLERDARLLLDRPSRVLLEH